MKLFFAFFLSFSSIANASYYPGLQGHPLVDHELRKAITPHLIPLDHPIKPQLDLIFSQRRVPESISSIEGAGFQILHWMPRSLVVVARHPMVPGYLFKMHLDSEKKGRYGGNSIDWLIHRCVGAKKIQKIIEKKGIRHFVVPNKWLYLLPSFHMSTKSSPKPIILITEEMPITSDEETRLAWKQVAKERHFDELYQILGSGYGSVTLPTNIPYLGNGIFAFVDTEKPVLKKRLKKVQLYISEPMKKYWRKLIE